MKEVVFVLMMLWGGESSQSGLAVVQQEFSSFESCEAARKVLEQAHGRGYGMRLKAQGCFKK
jgi:hypothetical protein